MIVEPYTEFYLNPQLQRREASRRQSLCSTSLVTNMLIKKGKNSFFKLCFNLSYQVCLLEYLHIDLKIHIVSSKGTKRLQNFKIMSVHF